MAKNLKNKKVNNYLALSLIFITITVASAFVPQSPLSVLQVFEKYQFLTELNQRIENNEVLIVQQDRERANLEQQGFIFQQKKTLLEQKLNNMNLDIHMPSILILLEQNAKRFALDLEIVYDQIKEMTSFQDAAVQDQNQQNQENANDTNKSNNNQTASNAQNVETQQNFSTSNEQQSNNSKKNDGTSNTQTNNSNLATSQKNTSASKQQSANASEEQIGTGENISKVLNILKSDITAPANNNIFITAIPIKVKGKYSTIRSYLNYLDKIDFIEPVYIEMASSGNEIESLIVLYVFHSNKGVS